MDNKPVMVITGTRTGIGKHLAEYYVQNGFQVIGCSRGNIDFELDNYKHYCLDISDESSIKKIFNKMKKGDLSKAERFGLKSEIDKMDKIMDAIEKYDLESKYKKIIITDMGTFNAAKNKWNKRKRELKYGVQEMPKAAE